MTVMWLRWSLRDLRQRWPLVLAVALVIALGTGVYAGLGAATEWRRASNRASYAQARMHDLRVRLAAGSTVGQGTLRRAASSIAHASDIVAGDERLVLPTQIETTGAGGGTVLVAGEVLGVPPVQQVDLVHVDAGRRLGPADAGRPVVLLETKFARVHDLPARGRAHLSGGREVSWVGHGVVPEYFVVTGESTAFATSERTFAAVLTTLATAQELTGRPGAVNDLVVRLRAGADRDVVRRELEAALAEARTAATVETREDDRAHRRLTQDAEGDDTVFTLVALLVLAGAAFAAFNLTTRIVESQRREIGIGMALGVSPGRAALRPVLVGAEVSVLGVVLGVGVGLLMDVALGRMFRELMPLPVWVTEFQPLVFLRAAVAGFVLPLAAAVLPVRRAVRVEPVEAIRTTHLSGGTGLLGLGSKLRLPGRALRQLPLRNVLRTPRRTLLTALGLAASLTTLVGILGLLDSFMATIDRGSEEALRTSPDRITVHLDRFYPVAAPQIDAIGAAGTVGSAETSIRVGGAVTANGERVDVVVDVANLDTAMWTPTIVDRAPLPLASGIVLSQKAAEDLRVEPGDTVVFRHPQAAGPGAFRTVESQVPVSALHPNPMRPFAYMDASRARLFGLEGLANVVQVRPNADASAEDVRRAVSVLPGVASVQPLEDTQALFEDTLSQVVGVLRTVQGAVLVLALLIAFNAASIAVDERSREHATMFAFGLPVRRVLAMTTKESMVIGVLGTLIGVVAGYGLVVYAITNLLPATVPEIGLEPAVTPVTVLTAAVLGIAAVAVAPLLTVRKLVRMDVPSTLRVVE